MLKVNVYMHRKNRGYEIRAVMGFARVADKEHVYADKLLELQRKLEQVIPASMRAKFNLNKDELIVNVMSENAAEAIRVQSKLEDFIATAMTALKLR